MMKLLPWNGRQRISRMILSLCVTHYHLQVKHWEEYWLRWISWSLSIAKKWGSFWAKIIFEFDCFSSHCWNNIVWTSKIFLVKIPDLTIMEAKTVFWFSRTNQCIAHGLTVDIEFSLWLARNTILLSCFARQRELNTLTKQKAWICFQVTVKCNGFDSYPILEITEYKYRTLRKPVMSIEPIKRQFLLMLYSFHVTLIIDLFLHWTLTMSNIMFSLLN